LGDTHVDELAMSDFFLHLPFFVFSLETRHTPAAKSNKPGRVQTKERLCPQSERKVKAPGWRPLIGALYYYYYLLIQPMLIPLSLSLSLPVKICFAVFPYFWFVLQCTFIEFT
jgi:hypothetical protein